MNPQVIVERQPSEKEYTLSEFFIRGIRRGVGVEDEHREVKVHGETRIPNDIYELDLTYSPKFSASYYVDQNGFISTTKTARFSKEHDLIIVKNVPNFSSVLWHWGNSDLDTDACYIMGSYFGKVEVTVDKKKEWRNGVLGSRVKYVEVYPILWAMITQNKAQGIKTFVEYRDKVYA